MEAGSDEGTIPPLPTPPATEEPEDPGPEEALRRLTETLTKRPSNFPRWMEMDPAVEDQRKEQLNA